ncbi:C6 transcription factor [Pyrenophora tritici-repentis]|nr:C6 transcription factor [Pyrenophora tritici-repentis]
MSAKPSHERSEQAQEPGPSANKRRRVGLACNACRMRKSRCDGQRPSCSSCVSLDFDCQYESSESATNVIVRKDYMSDLDSRMTAMESKLQRFNDLLRGHLTPCADTRQATIGSSVIAQSQRDESSQPPNRADIGQTLVAGMEEPQDDDAATNGMAMVFIDEHTSAFFGESSNINFTQLLLRAVAIARQTDIQVPGTKDHASFLDDGNVSGIHHSQPQSKAPFTISAGISITSLPEVAVMNRLLDTYFDTAGVVFPFLLEETTRKTYSECLKNGFKRARRTWLGTLNMMFALATMLDRENFPSAKKRFERGDLYYHRAVGLCGELSKHVVSLETVHYLLMVVMYCQGTQRSVQAWNIHGLLTRSAMALGLHSCVAGKHLDPIQAEYQRRTWVIIYCLDKVLSAAFGRPASVPDEHAVDRQPSAALYHTPSMSESGADIPGDFLAVSFELYQVMSKSLVKQYSATAQQRDIDLDDLKTLQASVEFRKSLRMWAASLPPYLGLCDAQPEILAESSRLNRLRVILSLRYHNLSILVHRPLLSITIGHLFRKDDNAINTAPYFIQLAMAEAEECVQSAEATINIAHAVISADSTSKNNLGAWYFTLYYVFTASLVISARFLWTQHDSLQLSLAAIEHSRKLLKKAEKVFQHLDSDNNLVLSCWKYIHELSIMCQYRSTSPYLPYYTLRENQSIEPVTGGINTRESVSEEQPTEIAAWPNISADPTSMSNSFLTVPPDANDIEVYQLFAREMFDPSTFEINPYGAVNGDDMMF